MALAQIREKAAYKARIRSERRKRDARHRRRERKRELNRSIYDALERERVTHQHPGENHTHHGIDERYTQEKQVLNEDGTETPKRIVKGARLKLYPVGMNIYRASKGIVRPVSQELTPEQAAKEKASAGTLTFSAAVAVLPDCGSGDGDSVSLASSQIISKEYYNAKRAKSQ